ncbi:MAG: endonuclease III [Proteobacteria bacterium TMED61]|nr:MAG: endonuclease III [Proteobacteria bacterium TMED61]
MNAAQRNELFARLQKSIPEPVTELKYRTRFQLLVSVILSAQATDLSVNRATRKLFRTAATPEAIQNLGVSGLKQYIRTIGLYNTKAVNIIKTCSILLNDHAGRVPRERSALEALPGVGRKTANVVLNTAFGEPTIAVDTHIFRVANRTGLAKGRTVLQVERGLLTRTPEPYLKPAHHLLILHGRYTCRARNPLCGRCVIFDLCQFSAKRL